MSLQLSDADEAFRTRMRTFFTEQIPTELRVAIADGRAPSAEDIVATQRITNAAGLAVPHWPERWGGQDWTPLQHHIWQHEMNLACVAPPLSSNTNLVGPVLAEFGSDEQKERFLPAVANLDIWFCQGFSEPEAGSDLASLRTAAVRSGDKFIVNGQKLWTTNAHHADWIFCLVRTDPSASRPQRGISFLLIDLKTPGITIRPIYLIDGAHEVNEVFFEDVEVPAENLVGELNKGWQYAKFLLGNERSRSIPVGMTRRQLARAKAHAARTTRAGKPLLTQRWVAERIALIENELVAVEITALRSSANSHGGEPDPASSVLKLRMSELQQEVTELLVDLAGPNSVAAHPESESDIAAWVRHAAADHINYRKTTIYGGASEIQRTIIAKSILGL
ncbi:acyl-CoA dehydrogenase family protein [Mycobacterium sp. C31M]